MEGKELGVRREEKDTSPLTPHASQQGFFLVFEGPEGSGKSTQIRLLAERLRAAGCEPLLSREPGGTPAADAIRQVILDPKLRIDPLSEFLLYSASRAQHVSEVIKPALEAGKLVLCDRFAGASVAYQGYGRGLELDFIHELTARVTHNLKPDLTILLELEPEIGLKRIAARGNKDRLERADLSFHQRVHEGFLAQAKADSSWVIIDAEDDETALAEKIWQTVQMRLPL